MQGKYEYNFEQKEAKGAKQDKREIVCCLARSVHVELLSERKFRNEIPFNTETQRTRRDTEKKKWAL